MKKISKKISKILMAVLLASCQGEAKEVSKENSKNLPVLVEAYQNQCVNTQGKWDPILLSCQCPSSSGFIEEQGCTEVIAKECSVESENFEVCIKKPYENLSVTVYLEDISSSEKEIFLRKWKENPLFLLKRLTLPKTQKDIPITFSNWNVLKYRMTYDGLTSQVYVPNVIPVRINLKGILQQDKEIDYISKCFEAIKAESKKSEEEVKKICETSDAFKKDVLLNKKDSFEESFFSYGENCNPSCGFILEKNNFKYSVRFLENLPSYRMIRMKGDNFKLYILLDASGKEAGFLYTENFIHSDKKYFLKTIELMFNPQWEKMSKDEYDRGETEALNRALSSLQDEIPASYEDLDFILKGSMDVALIDQGFDFSKSLFKKRLVFENPIDNIFNFLSHVFLQVESSHGLEVSSVLVRNLENIKVHPLHYDNWDQKGVEESIEFIKKRNVKVINLSLGEESVQCSNKFSKLFSSLPNVLFVVGSGNTGTKNPDFCPANLWQNFDNVISVSGVNDFNEIHSSSSYGEKVSTLATHFSSPCIKANGSLGQCSGTSISAPIISNLASRIWIKDLSLSVKQVIEKLNKNCIPSELDVAWRCRIDYERWLRDEK